MRAPVALWHVAIWASAGVMVVFVALIPFFAVKELGRVMGRERIGRLFFRHRSEA